MCEREREGGRGGEGLWVVLNYFLIILFSFVKIKGDEVFVFEVVVVLVKIKSVGVSCYSLSIIQTYDDLTVRVLQ